MKKNINQNDILVSEKLFYSKIKFIKLLFILFILVSNVKIKSNSKNKIFNSNISSFNYNNISNNFSLPNKEYIKNNFTFNNNNKTYNNTIEFSKKYNLGNLSNLINQLNENSNIRQAKFLIFSDFYTNPYCNDINSYLLFEYYIKNNETNAFYIINADNDLYKELVKKNKTTNLIPIHSFGNFLEIYFLIY
jgi:hypothetical protein